MYPPQGRHTCEGKNAAGVFGGVYIRGGSAGLIAEGLAVVVGDDDTGSRTGIRLPTRYSFSSLGDCAAVSGPDGVVAQATSASAMETIMSRCMRNALSEKSPPCRSALARRRKKSGDCTGDCAARQKNATHKPDNRSAP
jgi:hypothetical protein